MDSLPSEIIPPMEEMWLSKKSRKSIIVKPTRKYKVCPRGQRRHPVTRRCRTKCRPGFTRSRKSKKCVKN